MAGLCPWVACSFVSEPLDKLLSEGLRLVALYSLSRLALGGQITPTQIFSFETSFTQVKTFAMAVR